MALRPLSKVDQLLLGVDKALRAVVPHSNLALVHYQSAVTRFLSSLSPRRDMSPD